MSTKMIKKLMSHEHSGDFSKVQISLASPEVMSSWSHGEVKNPETINYRTFKPEKGGLFCEKTFGPVRDWECNCGKYSGSKHRNIVCDRCGVEVTLSKVRRERMGHLNLAIPVTHIWFFKCMPSSLALVLNMTSKALEKVIYYEQWIVTDPGDTPLGFKQLLSDEEYYESLELYGTDSFKVSMGAQSIHTLLSMINLEEEFAQLNIEIHTTKSKATHKKLSKRMRILQSFLDNGAKPEWMVINTLPVIPPDLRPLVPLDGGRFATSDLNDLYRRVINRNNRLKHLLSLKTPEVIIRNEKRMLQEAVDSLLDNGRHGRAVTGTGNRPLKSLCDMLKGKTGRFRQNLLGKRVDYSGRSVIVVGPELKLHQCGIPKEMALVLFEPFIIGSLISKNIAQSLRAAKKMIDRREKEVWDILEEVTTGHPVLLNRAPTLHRLSIQAFDPVLIEGKAIRIHPLVCSAYNADFDGDQMAVHVPLSYQAQLEAKLLMLAPNNIFSPASGKPLCTPTQDMTLGIYFVTYMKEKLLTRPVLEDKYFGNKDEVRRAIYEKLITLHEPIQLKNPDFGTNTVWGESKVRFIRTTAGRVMFSEIFPNELGFPNLLVKKSHLGQLITDVYDNLGHKVTTDVLDKLKEIGFEYATESGFSVSTADMIVPKTKSQHIKQAFKDIGEIRSQYQSGLITNSERYNKSIDIWTTTNQNVAEELFITLQNNNDLDEINPVWAMMDSGARGSKDQIRQLSGMRGLMAKPNGDIIERPIISNFRDGLTVLEYFISSHGARKGLADTALKTADSGYMTRKLVDASQDVICSGKDCGTTQGIILRSIGKGDDVKLPLADRLIGRVTLEDIKVKKKDGKLIHLIKANQPITKKIADAIQDYGIEEVLVRSALTCEAAEGVCANCYGILLASGEFVEKGDAIGIIAAQSIGEPGTQLTMRTFHVGGTAKTEVVKPIIEANKGGELTLFDVRFVKLEDGTLVVTNKNGRVALKNESGLLVDEQEVSVGSIILYPEGTNIEKNQSFMKWDPHNIPIITEESGKIKFDDIVDGVTLKTEINATTGQEEKVVLEHREDLHPQISVVNSKGKVLANYSLPSGAYIMVKEADSVKAGSTLARIPRQGTRTKDITGGLPRISELFEARQPSGVSAEIAHIDGIITFGAITKGKRLVKITDQDNEETFEEMLIPTNKRLLVSNGDIVKKGQILTDGAVVLKDMLDICGAQELQEYLVNEVQKVYRLQGVEINDKHIEVVVRQMMTKVVVTDSGSTNFYIGEEYDKKIFTQENQRVIQEGGEPAKAQPVLLGITKASLKMESFISAASFQDTTRVLTEATILGKTDILKGFKENVIMGHLIPAGSGLDEVRNVKLEKPGEFVGEEDKSYEKVKERLADARELLSLDDD